VSRGSLVDRLGIRGRVLVLAVVPVATVALLLGYGLISSRLEDARTALADQGRASARNLALAAEFPTFSKNSELLDRIIEQLAADPDVRWAAVWDRDRRTLFSRGEELPEAAELVTRIELGQGPGEAVFQHPIGTGFGAVTDFAEEFDLLRDDGQDAADAGNIGWALVAMSNRGVLAREAEIVRGGVIIVLVGLTFSVLLGLAIGNGITGPVRRLMEAVQQLRSGKLDTRVRRSTGGELGELEDGINQMARALEEGQTQLRERIRAATTALQQTVGELERKNLELESARQAALHVGHERTQFLARMSHEIRTPLNAVVGFTKLLDQCDEGKAPAEYVRTIQSASQQLLHVIDDILQFIRLDANADQLEIRDFEPAACLEDVIAMLSPLAAEKGLELALLLHSDLPQTISGDPGRLAQVVVNLTNNALKFTERGHVVVEAGFSATDTDSGVLEIAVSDTGPGLLAEDQEKIFSAFTQGDSSVTRRHGGAGLGLSIAKRLVELMGGHIELASAPDQGAHFTVFVPCSRCAAPKPLEQVEGVTGRRVLLYDANAVTRRGLRSLMFGWGIQTFNTGKLERLVELLEQDQFDLVIVGMSRAQSEESEAARLIATVCERHAGPLLLLSGTPGWRPPAGCGDAAVAASLKPVRRDRLLQLFETLFTGASLHASPAAPVPDARADALAGMRVLAAEDNEFNRLLLREVLEARGALVVVAVNGIEALEKAQAERFDLVLMDLHMPELDGAAAASAMRRQLGDACPPILALTADVFGEAHLPNQDLPFDGWLLKPIDPTVLEEHLAELGSARQAFPTDRAPDQRMPAMHMPPELRRRYYAELTVLCRRTRAALADRDRAALHAGVHDLLGVAGIMGQAAVLAAVRELAAAAHDGETLRAEQLLEVVETTTAAAQTELARMG
jgi:two-component system sensor histidine kinase BarA